jgi:hypothetical protein
VAVLPAVRGGHSSRSVLLHLLFENLTLYAKSREARREGHVLWQKRDGLLVKLYAGVGS